MTGPGAGTVLVLNCGSSSVKYRLVDPGAGSVLAHGLVERIGQPQGHAMHERLDGRDETDGEVAEWDARFADHDAALAAAFAAFDRYGPDLGAVGLAAVGHRVVHGGERFTRPTVLDDDVVAAVEALAVLAPLHIPANVEGIRLARRHLPDVPHVAVFDTAFHATMPPHAATYAVPADWRTRHGVRRYGFHGSSHAYVSREAARFLGRPVETTNSIVLHLGNGCSACAVSGGRSVDTSMGLTPLSGLVMGTRSGDVDPALSAHLARVADLDVADIEAALNGASGLLALAGVSDVREVTRRAAAGDPDARLALNVYCYRIRCSIGGYHAALGELHVVAFTGGVGEHSALVRELSLTGLAPMGIRLDPQRNADPGKGAQLISSDDSPVAVLVIPTDEEREIAAQTLSALRT